MTTSVGRVAALAFAVLLGALASRGVALASTADASAGGHRWSASPSGPRPQSETHLLPQSSGVGSTPADRHGVKPRAGERTGPDPALVLALPLRIGAGRVSRAAAHEDASRMADAPRLPRTARGPPRRRAASP